MINLSYRLFQFILVSSFLFLLISCESKKITSLNDVLENISPDEQKNTIDPSKENIIEGDKGTKIFIPANAFIFPDGSVVTDKVTVTLNEFYSVSDIISNSLSTRSGYELLETGGMINITAKADGKKLSLGKTSSLVVAFPNKDTAKKMETFYGSKDTSGINWEPAFGGGGEGDYLNGLDSTLIDSTMNAKKFTLCGYLAMALSRIEWKLKHKDSTIFRYIENNFPLTDTSVFNYFSQNGLSANMDLSINSAGKVYNINFSDQRDFDSTSPPPLGVQQFLITFFKKMPPFEMGSMQVYGDDDTYFISLCYREVFDWEEYNRRFKVKYSQYLDNTVKNMGPKAIDYYFLSVGQLGWINCDRFLDDSSEKIDFVVNIPGSTDGLGYIAFDSLNSIMKGEKKGEQYIFRNMPVNSKISVIGINYRDGSPLMAKTSTKITKTRFTLTGFREFTLKELETEINKK